ncbi:MAG: hypothetical protein ACLFVL_04100 [Candidatus Aenigmatarchaeota archaeon]
MLAVVLLSQDYSREKPGGSYEEYVENWEDIGVPNLVMGILADCRVYDSVGEAVIFFTGVLGAYLLMEDKKDDDESDS